MLEDKMKERDGLYGCRLYWKTKRKKLKDRMVVVYAENQTQDMTDHIGVVYARRQNERTRRIIWVPSTPKTKQVDDEGKKVTQVSMRLKA